MDTIPIKYCFTLPDGTEQVYDLQLDRENLELRGNTQESIPSWVNLDFFQCPNCPLSTKIHPHCPLVLNFVSILNKAVAERLRAATETDSSVNAIILLDVFAQALPFVIEESLEEIRYLFAPFFTQENL